ncbi:hypothetical protein [Leuconostoc mesenteroides]|nr:hypothetical protein [Leuconostoc mesenteroides]
MSQNENPEMNIYIDMPEKMEVRNTPKPQRPASSGPLSTPPKPTKK